MSAYICDPKTFIALAAFAVRRDRYGSLIVGNYNLQIIFDEAGNNSPRVSADEMKPHEKADRIANILRDENIRSVHYRYPKLEPDELPGDIGDGFRKITAARLVNTRAYPPIEVIKACHCLAYQSCETEDWESTPAFRLLNLIEGAAVRQLPGYDDAPWGIE